MLFYATWVRFKFVKSPEVTLESDSSETVEVIIVKLDTVTASEMRMHQVLIILTVIFIQGHTYLNYSSNAHQVAVKIVTKGLYMTIESPMTLTFIQGRKCVSNLTTIWLDGRLMHAILYISSCSFKTASHGQTQGVVVG